MGRGQPQRQVRRKAGALDSEEETREQEEADEQPHKPNGKSLVDDYYEDVATPRPDRAQNREVPLPIQHVRVHRQGDDDDADK